MRFQRYILNEVYIKARHSNKSIEVLENPTTRDMRKISKYIRFICILKNKKVYVWDAEDEVHAQAYKKLGLGSEASSYYYDFKDDKIFGGEAVLKGSKYVVTNSDAMRAKEYDQKYIDMWQWVDKYIDISTFFNKYSMLKFSRFRISSL